LNLNPASQAYQGYNYDQFTAKLGGYTVANLSAGYKLGAAGWAKHTTFQFQVDNIFNRTDIIAQNGTTQTSTIPGATGGDPLFWTLYGRTFNISLSSTF
jgi:iron complex outermembrane receptor protein